MTLKRTQVRYPHSSSQSPVTPVPGTLMLPSSSAGTWCVYMLAGKTLILTFKNKTIPLKLWAEYLNGVEMEVETVA